MTTEGTHLVRLTHAAEHFGVNPRTIRRRITDGTIHGYHLGSRLIFVDLDEIQRTIAQGKHNDQ